MDSISFYPHNGCFSAQIGALADDDDDDDERGYYERTTRK